MRKFIALMVINLLTGFLALQAQEGFVIGACDYAPTQSSHSIGQLFYNSSTNAGYLSEGLQQSFLYHGEDTALAERRQYPGYFYRSADRNPSRSAHTLDLGHNNNLYLLPNKGLDSLINVMAYGVTFVNDTSVVAPYSSATYPVVLQEPGIHPNGSVPPVSYDNDAPAEFEVGVTTPVTWNFRVANRSLTNVQMVTVNFPPCGDTVVATDWDGNVYLSVRVGALCWTKSNLRSEHYADGVTVPNPMTYVSSVFPDPVANLNTYGHLYNWYDAVRIPAGDETAQPVVIDGHVQGICPDGWRLPSKSDLQTLEAFSAMDLMSTEGWIWGTPNNSTEMTLLPAGFYTGYRFESMGGETYLWSYTECSSHLGAWICSIIYGCDRPLIKDSYKQTGMSVRCIKN